jgi:hypothetical protein
LTEALECLGVGIGVESSRESGAIQDGPSKQPLSLTLQRAGRSIFHRSAKQRAQHQLFARDRVRVFNKNVEL